jgi:hypothetical protein
MNYIKAVIAQLVERWLPKPKVAGSSPVYRSGFLYCVAGREVSLAMRVKDPAIRAPFTALLFSLGIVLYNP